VAERVLAFQSLSGRSVVRWVGNEMAIREEGPAGAPVFHDPSIPYLQVCPLYLELLEGGNREILTYQGVADDWGLCIDVHHGLLPDQDYETGSIFRTRPLDELPVGLIDEVLIVQDGKADIVEVCLDMEQARLTLRSGQVYNEPDGLRVRWQDESVLVAVTPK
jgi:hypothetical protein